MAHRDGVELSDAFRRPLAAGLRAGGFVSQQANVFVQHVRTPCVSQAAEQIS
jgi:hypothetical protein